MTHLEDTTRKAIRSETAMQTEGQLAHAALQKAIAAKDLAEVERCRIWVGNIQREQREARLLLLAHVSDRMSKEAGTQLWK